MNPFSRLALFVAVLCAPLLLSTSFGQGSLNPPGPPAPTMKTLDELAAKIDQAITRLDEADTKAEKRTPISSLPFTIDQPGSYYLTGNLQFTAESGHAITIAANDVTLDLMGFTLSSTSAVTGNAITIDSGRNNVGIRNGAITGSTTVTISGIEPDRTWSVSATGGFSRGVSGGDSSCRISDLRISRCGGFGIGAVGATIERVSATANGNTGVVLSTTADGHGIAIDCVASGNAGSGFVHGRVLSRCIAENNEDDGFSTRAAAMTNCSASFNGSDGIDNDGSVINCIALSNGNDGIEGQGVIAFCYASNNNRNNNGSLDIDAPAGATRTGNKPTP